MRNMERGRREITYEQFCTGLERCFSAGAMEQFFILWEMYPDYVQEMAERAKQEPQYSQARESWARFRERMRREYGHDIFGR